MNASSARQQAPFARATREALESVAAQPIATSLLYRALTTGQLGAVPEDTSGFRAFVEGPLRAELSRALGAGSVSLVIDRLGETIASSVRQSGSHPVIPPRERGDQTVQRRPTVPAMVAPKSDPAPAPRPKSPVPMRKEEATRAPRGLRPAAVTHQALPRVARMPSSILVVSTDPGLSRTIEAEVAMRVKVAAIGSPADLARLVTTGGDHIVVLFDTRAPSIDLATFVGLSPIMPISTRVALWGADEALRDRLAQHRPALKAWAIGTPGCTPGELALSVM